MADAGDVVKAAAWWKPKFGLLKSIPMVGLLAGAAVVAPFVLNSFRENRKFNDNAPLPMPKGLSDPLPPVLDFTAAQPVAPTMADPHFGAPLQEGAMGKRIRMQRAGLEASPDMTPPNVLTPNNVSVIDGKPLTELNGKHVTNIQKDSSVPGFNGPG